MSDAERVTIENSHIYPGANGAYHLAAAPGTAPRDVRVEFNDGMTAAGRLSALPGPRRRLEVDGYTTARGAHIPPKVWILQNLADDDSLFRVREHGESAQIMRASSRRRMGRSS